MVVTCLPVELFSANTLDDQLIRHVRCGAGPSGRPVRTQSRLVATADHKSKRAARYAGKCMTLVGVGAHDCSPPERSEIRGR